MKADMLRRDLGRNRVVTTTLLLFLLMAALLISCAVSMIMTLLGSVDSLFEAARAPHFVQMHSGSLDQAAIDAFVSEHPQVAGQQTVEMQNVRGDLVWLGSSGENEAQSVMEIAFVTQNEGFDLLLNLENQVAQVTQGQVGVPLYYMEQNGLQVGDRVVVQQGVFRLELTIATFLRDAQMNPSIVTSKRFLVSEADWQEIGSHVGTGEYLIEFLFYDRAETGAFEQAYAASGLPQNDTAVTYGLFQLMAGLSDGLVAGVLILIGLLLVVIALLALRYTILAALEEDVRELGVMKAIGLSPRDIRGLYLTKYLLLAGGASVLGYLLSLPLAGLFTGGITLYMGAAPKTAWSYLIPLAATALVFLLILAMVWLVLRRVGRISAAEALRQGVGGKGAGAKGRIALYKRSGGPVNLWLALQDLWLNLKSYGLLLVVFALCAFLVGTPMNLYTTVSSPAFISYMGAGRSDLRVDLQKTEEMHARYGDMAAYLAADPDVSRYAIFVTGTFQAKDGQGTWGNLKVETGDFSVFPVEYQEGGAPAGEHEIALSSMNAEELEKAVGDDLTLLVEGEERVLTVCGIYQDITNGGKTAKALLPVAPDEALWYVMNLDLNPGVSIGAKKTEYAALFAPAKVLDMEDYLGQTLGIVAGRLQLIAVSALVVAAVVSILMTAMFARMLAARERRETAILSSLGFTVRDIQVQAMLRMLLVLMAGILLGTLLIGSLGQSLAGLVLSAMGATQLQFVTNPWISYLLCPGILLCSVTGTVLAGGRAWTNTSPIRLNLE